MSDHDAPELYRKYRPSKMSEVVGQKPALASLNSMGKGGVIPHCLLFTGPSGTGKTTICRILRDKLKCSKQDYAEVNMAKDTGVEGVRNIERRMNLKPMDGPVRVWMLDEVQQATKAAQSCLLKMLEDTPDHVYFFLATTNPEKLLPTIMTRATEVKLKEVEKGDLTTLITRVARAESFEVSKEVAEKISEHSDGSARKALVILHSIMQIEDENDRLDAIVGFDNKAEAIDLARALIARKGGWKKVADLIKKFDSDAEQARRVIIGYASSVLLGGGAQAPRAFLVIDSFRDNFFDSGKAGLAASAYEVFHNTE